MSLPTQSIGGLISGLDTNNIIDQLMQIEHRPIDILQTRVQEKQTELEAYRGINDLLLNFQSNVSKLASQSTWDIKQSFSTDESVLTATAGELAATGTHIFQVGRLARTAQFMSTGFADRDQTAVTPYAGGEIRIDNARSRVDRGTNVSLLNGGTGIYHGKIKITDKAGGSAVIDLSTAETVQEVMDAINTADGISVKVTLNTQGGANPQVIGDALVVTDTSGGGGSLIISDYSGSSTATDLGIAGTDASTPGSITGSSIYYLGSSNTLASLNDGLGVNNGTAGTIRIKDQFTPTVDGTTTLASLHAGDGVNGGSPGKIVAFDGTNTHVIDLTAAATMNDVINAINTDSGGVVTAAIGADNNLVLTSSTGELTVFSDGADNTTAEDLGIVDVSTTGTITGDDLSLYSFDVDLSQAGTIQGVLDAINNAAGNKGVTASVNGRGLTLTGAGVGTIAVEDVGTDNTTAHDLGIAQTDASGTITGYSLMADLNSVRIASLSGRYTFGTDTALNLLNDGAGVPVGTFDITDKDGNSTTIDTTGTTTVQDVLDIINNDATINVFAYADEENGRIVLVDNTTGSGTLQVSSTATSTGLGIAGDDTATPGRVQGTRVYSEGINGSRNNLGQSLGDIRISDNGGGTWQTISLADFTGANSLSDVIERLNQDAAAAFGADQLEFSVNAAGNGIQVTNLSAGTTYQFDDQTGTAATDLGLAGASVASASTYNGGDLDRNYISRATKLKDMNNGKGVSKGSITFVNSKGLQGNLDISQAETVGEVIDMINSGTMGIHASINATGDGILLTDTNGGGAGLKIEEAFGGTTARDLGILGAGATSVNGSFEKTITVDTNDTLTDVMNKLDDSGAPITSSIIYDGSEFNPYRLVLTSDDSGMDGDFVLDTDIAAFGFKQNTRGQDSILLYGQQGGDVSPVMLASSNNTNNTAVLGLTLNLKKASADPVTITVNEDTSVASQTIQDMAASYNDLVEIVAQLDTFDEETNTPGILFGDSSVRSLMTTVSDLFFTTAQNPGSSLVTFYDIGVKFETETGSDGRQRAKLSVDTGTLESKLRNDFDAVKELLTATVDVARKDMNAGIGGNTTADDDPNQPPGSKFDLDNLINGNTLSSDFGIANGYQAADTIASGQNQITVSFGQPRKLSRIVLHHVNSSDMPADEYALRDFKVEYLNSATNQWDVLRNVSGNTSAQNYMSFRVPTMVSQLRITASSTNAADGKFRLTEIQADEVQGLAGTMNTVTAELTDGTTGFFATQQDSLTSQIDDLNQSIEDKEARLEQVQLNYLRQFAAMESALAQLQSQGDFFAQQMDALTSKK